ncbi:DNA processing protein DprA, putative [Rhodoferax ferrireducens T118]|uniref:DNA processing protein DprA, putative n=1 Tax=Albidiferax ferrireducens (strain ATCC BAA-621 / DSM 15236 / T118) TaxID=338969 RepID=Q21RP2_ALBFT|nr:DNA-processing protein DprA [Rhodoferax ferrireducens]ABD71561.1 DNA processing protein DprA, putative [Rhodoferax ferrireducens T118]
MERDELAAWLRLTLSSGVGNEAARKLLVAFGLPAKVFEQSSSTLQQVVSARQATALRAEPPELAPLLEQTWAWLRDTGVGSGRRQIVVLGDANYPQSLLNIEDPPLMLYLLGAGEFMSNQAVATANKGQAATTSVVNKLALRLANSIAVVGSRNPTPQGAVNARQFAKALGLAGLTVVSGLALGVDGAAHEGALDSLAPGSDRLATVAVVGTGLDRVYPKRHLALAHRIAQNGLLISEYPLGTPPLPANFPKRNRLIAGLAQATLVIEAALKSGSLITARLSAEQGKDVFAIPGSIHSTQARGCHALIKQGAKLVESAQDVLEEMRIDSGLTHALDSIAVDACSTGATGSFGTQAVLLDAIGFDPVGLDALQARCGIDTAGLQAQLMTLELDGLLVRLPGGLFQRMSRG